MPDQKLGLQNFLGIISRDILRNEQTLLKIRQGYTGFLNMEIIGRLWSASDILKKYYLDLQNFDQAKPEPDPLPNLEAIFEDKTKLKKLVKLLKDKNFVSEEAGRLYWIKKPVEFAAMAKTCLPLIKKEHQEPKTLHHAWTSMFLHKEKTPKDILTIQYFKTKAKENEIHSHLEKFEFIKFEFDIE
jgi:hypothetical protein